MKKIFKMLLSISLGVLFGGMVAVALWLTGSNPIKRIHEINSFKVTKNTSVVVGENSFNLPVGTILYKRKREKSYFLIVTLDEAIKVDSRKQIKGAKPFSGKPRH